MREFLLSDSGFALGIISLVGIWLIVMREIILRRRAEKKLEQVERRHRHRQPWQDMVKQIGDD